jgi:hypothetical protein
MEPGGILPPSQHPAICPFPEPEQFSPCLHPISWRHILILHSHLRFRFPSGLIPSLVPTKILYALLLSPTCATYPTDFVLLKLMTRKISESRTLAVMQVIIEFWQHIYIRYNVCIPSAVCDNKFNHVAQQTGICKCYVGGTGQRIQRPSELLEAGAVRDCAVLLKLLGILSQKSLVEILATIETSTLNNVS